MELKLPLPYEKKLNLYIKSIVAFENTEPSKHTTLPFFADGYPGIIFQQAASGLFLRPKNKRLAEFFLYGQTINPIELWTTGSFRLIVFQLYPFAARTLFGINPKRLNDDCFNLTLPTNGTAEEMIVQLRKTTAFSTQMEIIAEFLTALIDRTTVHPDHRIQLAISLILNSKGKISLKTLRENLHVTERTLERQFSGQIGVSPKQFIKIIQFSTSLRQLSENDYARLSDIAYENEYADHAHFIRMFKKFTGKTPSEFQKSIT